MLCHGDRSGHAVNKEIVKEEQKHQFASLHWESKLMINQGMYASEEDLL